MLHYEIKRNKTTDKNSNRYLILIHGIGGNIKTFKKMITPLSKTHCVLTIDLNGHGKSKTDGISNNLVSMEYVASEINKILVEENIEKGDFLGFSLGTMVVATFKIMFPEKVNKIVMLGDATNQTLYLKALARLGYYSKFLRCFKFSFWLFANILMPFKRHKLSRSYTIKEALSMDGHEFFSWVKLIINFYDNFPIDKVINIGSILYLSGEDDVVFLGALRRKVRKLNNTNLKLIVIKDAGHVVHLDQPSIITEIVNFLNDFICVNMNGTKEIAIDADNLMDFELPDEASKRLNENHIDCFIKHC